MQPPQGHRERDTTGDRAFLEVSLLGDAATPAPDRLVTFQFWSAPAGTVQPAGESGGTDLNGAALTC